MGQVITFPEQVTILQRGTAYCGQCAYRWEAKAPVGTTQLECPDCHALAGVWRHGVIPDEEVWQCECGNTLFFLVQSGCVCANCGAA